MDRNHRLETYAGQDLLLQISAGGNFDHFKVMLVGIDHGALSHNQCLAALRGGKGGVGANLLDGRDELAAAVCIWLRS